MRNECEFTGNIVAVRAVEDSIRVTKKYTEGIGTMRAKHPIQGEDFPSRMFCKYYEVYPDHVISWDMPAGEAIDWLWGDANDKDHRIEMIDVMFQYDYRCNKASVIIKDGEEALGKLKKAIPLFALRLSEVKNDHYVAITSDVKVPNAERQIV